MTVPVADPVRRRSLSVRHPRRAIGVAVVCAIAAVLMSGCAISTEQQPRPITRETTVVPNTVDGN